MWRARLGLAPEDQRLVEADPQPALQALQADATFTSAWRNYMKSALVKSYWYAFADKPTVLFFVLDNKTLAGREERATGDATGRKLVLSFYSRTEHDADLVLPVKQNAGALPLDLLTLAELVQTCELSTLPADPERSSAATELLIEAELLTLDLMRYEGTAEPEATPHAARLGEGCHAEEALCLETPLEDLTKMALARHLERNNELGARETLRSAWGLKQDALRNRARPLLPEHADQPVPHTPAARGRRGGRGGVGGRRGQGRGRGRA